MTTMTMALHEKLEPVLNSIASLSEEIIDTDEFEFDIVEAFKAAGWREPDAIDWERKFQQQISDNIRAKATTDEKLTKAQLELDQANRRIAELEKKLTAAEPALAKIKALEDRLSEQANSAGLRINRLNQLNRDLNKKVRQGQRSAIEDVIHMLHSMADRLPEPEPAPETTEVPE